MIFTVVTAAIFVLSIVAAVLGFGCDFTFRTEFQVTFFFLLGAFVLTFILGLLWTRKPPPPL